MATKPGMTVPKPRRPALPDWFAPLGRELDRGWWQLVLLAWLSASSFFLVDRWRAIRWLSLSDTDDNMRLMQVRALLAGQGWYDLRQYRLNPPGGFDMHWTRLVDLPIAGLILLLRPLVGPEWAERLACGIAPLLPLAVAMLALALIVRRLVHVAAWPLAVIFLLFCAIALTMFMPERIDHHGWQLAALAVALAGLVDPARRRGGLVLGAATAFSLSIGLEFLVFAAIAGAVTVLRWIVERDEALRLTAYGAALSLGCLIGYGGFASYANAAWRCDALTPVWLTMMTASGGALVMLGAVNPRGRASRIALAVLAGAALIALFAGAFPQCLGRPEQASPELQRNWLDNIREARPIYTHSPKNIALGLVLPLVGLIGSALATWRARGSERFVSWGAFLLFTALSVALLFWQARITPAAQLLAVPGAVALAWIVLPRLLVAPSVWIRVLGTAAAFVVISGGVAGLIARQLPGERATASGRVVGRAASYCPTVTAMEPLNRLPPQTIYTFVDFGPRLITLTHHRAIAGPYHRNGDAILDVQHGFQRDPLAFRRIAAAHGATLLLICPNLAESTVYRARYPGGFYDRLARGERFDFLEPLPLPSGSPLRLWRIKS